MWQQTEVQQGNAVANESPPRFVAGDRGVEEGDEILGTLFHI